MHILVKTQDNYHYVLTGGGGLKLAFGDKNPQINLWFDSSSSARVRCSLLEGLA
jgi:hypothetical protein